MQLDVADRGFAYSQDAVLDMRMDQTQGITAAEVLNTYPVGDLARILRTYGEEKFAGPLARAIVREREREPFTTSPRLVELIRDTIPAPPGGQAATPPSARSRRCASRSTPSSTSCAGRSRQPCPCSRWVVEWSS